MMREIKFRAWDDADGVHRDEGCMSYGITDITCDAAHIMQYTGLKDKNGKEIYEGNIVIDVMGPIGKSKPLLMVEYGGQWGHAGFVLTGLERFSNEVVEYSEDVLNQKWDNNLEVIGNIYENPELLED